MANFDILTVAAGGKQKRQPSSSNTFDFTAVRLGANNLQISQSGSGGSAYFNLNSRKLRGLTTPLSSETDAAATVDFVLNVAPTMLTWQNAVLDYTVVTPPGSPVTGDRYLVGLDTGGSAATGAWSGKDGQIAQWNGSAWIFTVSTNGYAVIADNDLNNVYIFSGTTWSPKAFASYTASTGIKLVGADFQRDDAFTFVNDNAGSISSGQVVYMKSNGNIDLALASTVTNTNDLGIVQDTSVASADPGLVTVREGAIISGYSSLTPGSPVYVSRSVAGALTQSTSGFVAGEALFQVGFALTDTQILLDPQFLFEY